MTLQNRIYQSQIKGLQESTDKVTNVDAMPISEMKPDPGSFNPAPNVEPPPPPAPDHVKIPGVGYVIIPPDGGAPYIIPFPTETEPGHVIPYERKPIGRETGPRSPWPRDY